MFKPHGANTERAGAQRGATSVGAHQQITLRDLWPACGHHDRKEQEVAGPPLLHHIEGLCAAAATSPASISLWPQKKTKKKQKKKSADRKRAEGVVFRSAATPRVMSCVRVDV